MFDTIASIATAPGEGALGIVRISGPRALSLGQKIFRPSRAKSACAQRSHTLRHGWVMDGIRRVDEVLLALYRAPRSYTGENIIEIIGHGGRTTMRGVLDACLHAGARLAQPGEFTKRAFLNGKMDLAQCEAVMDLISAASEREQKASAHRLEGGLSRWVRGLREELLGLHAPLEAAIDFPEEGVEGFSPRALVERLANLQQKVRSLVEGLQGSRIPPDGIRVAIVGRPNAGKSSLFNAMLMEERALVTSVAGTTRDYLQEGISHNGLQLQLIDTAGLRNNPGLVESRGIARSKRAAQDAQVILYLVDRSRALAQQDMGRNICKGFEANTIVVFTKCDLPARIDFDTRQRCSGVSPHCQVSSLSGDGLQDLKEQIARMAEGCSATREESISANLRQSELLTNAAEALCCALAGARRQESCETVAADLAVCMDYLGQITGDNASEELLDAIFSKFCIGK